MLMMTPVDINTEILICQNVFRENAARIQFGDNANQWRMFFLYDFEYVFKVAAGVMVFATVVLLLEILLDLIMKNKRKMKIRKRIVPKKQAQARLMRKNVRLELQIRNGKERRKGFLLHRRYSL